MSNSKESKGNSKEILISVYFPRSIDHEGVGTLLKGIAEGILEHDWNVKLLLPQGSSLPEHLENRVTVHYYNSSHLCSGLSYHKALVALADKNCDLLLLENNPNLAIYGAKASKQYRHAAWYFYTPLQPLSTLKELKYSKQAFVHAIAKSPLISRLQNWKNRNVIVSTDYQQDQLDKLGCKNVTVCAGSAIPQNRTFKSQDEARKELGFNDELIVGYLGHYSPAKGVDFLLKGFAQAHQKNKNLRLALAYSGKGQLGKEAQIILEQLREQNLTYEVGIVESETFLSACDITVLSYATSSIHHIPLVLVESFAAKTGVITTPVGGLKDLFTEGKEGAFVDKSNSEQITSAILKIIEQSSTSQCGEHARAFFESHFSRETLCQTIQTVLTERES